jgi:hypothetical protein
MATAPIRFSRSTGPAGFKRGQFGKVAAANKHNLIVTANLKAVLSAVPKYLLGGFAATALDTAIRNTKHDSSRFAANWNLSIGNVPPPSEGKPDPSAYAQTGESYGTIGERDAKGSHAMPVRMAKRRYYGYTNAAKGSDLMKLTKGRLAAALYPRAGSLVTSAKKSGPSTNLSGTKLSADQGAGTPPTIYLYNPFMRPGNWRRDTWGRTPEARAALGGKTYPQNALPQGFTDGTSLPAELSAFMGQGLVQELVVGLARRMKAANKQDTLLNPFV